LVPAGAANEEVAAMKCVELMERTVCVCAPDEPVQQVARRMRDHGIGFVPVCDADRRVLGTITDRDLVVRAVAAGCSACAGLVARDAMSTPVVACRPGDDLRIAEALMAHHQKWRIVCVADDGQLAGVISLVDIAQVEDEAHIVRLLRAVAARDAVFELL
jgi:CBS domain-containing protein